jgi:hypothetical protein
MQDSIAFAIRRSFLIPLGLLLLQILALLLICLVQRQPPAKIIILGVMILPLGLLFFESLVRRVIIAEDGLTQQKLWRRKHIAWDQVTSLDAVAVRKRVFLTLSAGDDFVIMSNGYARFAEMTTALLARVPDGTVGEEVRKVAASPSAKYSDIVSCWVAVALLAYILFIQLGGSF